MAGLKELPKNARVCIALEPLWAFFGPMVTYFMPLYQKELGLSEVQMGIVNSAGIAAGFVFFTIAAPITNKLGRRKTSLMFDFIAWSLSMLIWALSKSFTWFLVAAIFNAVVRIVNVSWNLLLSEDASEEQRSTIYGWIYVIGAFGGVTTFLGGLIIEKFGIVPSMRAIFGVGSAVMTTMFILRFIGTRETAVGAYLKEKTKSENFLRMVGQQLPKARQALRDPFFLRMTGIFLIANAVLSIDFFRVLYLAEQKKLPSFTVAVIPAIGALVSMAIFFLVLPRQKEKKNHFQLTNAFFFCMLFQILFLFMPNNSTLSALLIVPGLQASYFLLQTYRDTVFMNATGDEHKSERFSLVQALMLLFSIPMGWLAGVLYSVSPHLPFFVASLLYGLGFLLARGLKYHEQSN